MAKTTEKTELFCDYFERWIRVYKDGAIRKVTMNKYVLALSWLKKLIPTLRMGDMDRIAYQKLLTTTQSITSGKQQWTFIIN